MPGAGDPLKNVHAGERLRIPAAAWNGLVGMLKKFQAGAFDGGAPAQLRPLAAGQAFIRNDSGADRAKSELLGISAHLVAPAGAALDEFRARPMLVGIAPTCDHSPGRWAVCWEPIAAGQIGRAVISGPAHVKVNIVQASHRYADLEISGSSGSLVRLASADAGGARILATETTATGEQWCLVNMGVPHEGANLKFCWITAAKCADNAAWTDFDSQGFPSHAEGTPCDSGGGNAETGRTVRILLNSLPDWPTVGVVPGLPGSSMLVAYMPGDGVATVPGDAGHTLAGYVYPGVLGAPLVLAANQPSTYMLASYDATARHFKFDWVRAHGG